MMKLSKKNMKIAKKIWEHRYEGKHGCIKHYNKWITIEPMLVGGRKSDFLMVALVDKVDMLGFPLTDYIEWTTLSARDFEGPERYDDIADEHKSNEKGDKKINYYAELWLGEPIEDCKRICRHTDYGYEEYDIVKKEWIPFDDFSDPILVDNISEEEAMRIIAYQLDVRKKEITEIKEKLKNTGYDVDKLNDDELVKLWRKVAD